MADRIDWSVSRHWHHDLDWHPKTGPDVKDVLHSLYNKGRRCSIIYGDPASGAHTYGRQSTRETFKIFVRVGDPNSMRPYCCERRGIEVGDRIRAHNIVAILPEYGSLEQAIRNAYYVHDNLHYGTVMLQDSVLLEDGGGKDRWRVLIDGKEAARFDNADCALAWISSHGLTLHTLEDLYGGE